MSPANVIQNLFVGAAPERHDELKHLIQTYRPTFELAKDNIGTTYKAVRERIVWDHKSVTHDWLVTFAAWSVFRAYCPLIIVGRILGGAITNELISTDAELDSVEGEFDNMCYAANSIRLCSDLNEFPWPQEIPYPTPDRDGLFSDEERFCFDIALLAIAATFLHELAHVRFWADGNAPEDPREEERACDAFSREFLLSKVSDYALQTSQDAGMVLSKRVMGLATAAFAIDESSRTGGVADSHPTSGDRFRYLALQAPALENDDCWVYTASLMLASVRRRGRLPTEISFNSPLHLCKLLAESLDT